MPNPCRERVLSFRVTPAEEARIEVLVRERGEGLSSVVRAVVLRAVRESEALRAKEPEGESGP